MNSRINNRLVRVAPAALLIILVFWAASCASIAARPGGAPRADEAAVAEEYQKAEAYDRNFFYAKALATYQHVLEMDPNGGFADNALYKIAGIHMKQDRPEQAVLYFNRLQAEFPGSPYAVESIYNMAFCYYKMGDAAHALAVYEQYLALPDARNKGRARVLAAQALSDLGRYDESLAFYAVGCEEEPARERQVEILQSVKALMEKHMPPEKVLEALPKLQAGTVADYVRYRTAREFIAAGKRPEADKLLADIDQRHAKFRFYERAQKLAAGESGKVGTSSARSAATEYGKQPRLAVGIVLPLSGRFEVFGRQALHGIMLAVEDFGSVAEDWRIEIVIRDSEGEGEIAAKHVRELAKDPDLVAIVGPLLFKETGPAAQAAQEAEIPLIALSRKEDLGGSGPWVFRNAVTFTQQARALIAYADVHRGDRRFAVLYPENEFGQAFKDAFARELDPERHHLAAQVSYPADATDFKQQIRELQTAGDFDALFIPDSPERIALLAPQLVYYGLKDADLLGPSSWNKDDLATKAASYLKRAIIVDAFFARARDPKVTAFTQKYQDQFAEAPTILSALGYDSVGLLARVVRGGDGENRAAVRRGLLQIRAYPGVSGDSTFLENGEMEKTLILLGVGPNGIEERY